MDTNILRAANYPHLLENAPGMSSEDILERNNQNQDDSILKNTTMSMKNKYPKNYINNRKIEEFPDTGYYLDSSV